MLFPHKYAGRLTNKNSIIFVRKFLSTMKKLTFLTLSLLLTVMAFAQVAPDKYWVRFTDKNNSPYSVDNPLEFLSQRAIDRRLKQNIPIVENDLPVNQSYIDSVKAAGATVLTVSKWFNSVTVYTTDQNVIDLINSYSFVLSTTKAGFPEQPGIKNFENKPFFRNESFDTTGLNNKNVKSVLSNSYDYGQALNQIQMLNGDSLHNMGYDGNGIIIAVLDAGFLNVNTIGAFDSLWNSGRILGWRDFVSPQSPNIFNSHYHGCMVLSTMGANYPGQIVGTAPKASYWLLRTEDAATEYLIEELNWVSGAEFADSLGADVINSSLGYTEFDDPSQNHTYSDMDGNIAPITIGADIAASKGILVCNSAGNSGNSSWHYIGAPADGDSVFSVGAVDAGGNYVSFSSVGPTSDGRLKPNVMAQGSGTTIISPWSGNVSTGSGTSFSSPITAGMVACLRQANPAKSNLEIMAAVEQSSSLYTNPNYQMGYGIPDYVLANSILSEPDTLTFQLHLKVFLEGAFDGVGMSVQLNGSLPLQQPYNSSPFNYQGDESVTQIPENVVDWVLIELRDTVLPSMATAQTIIERKAAFLKTDGTVVDLDGTSNLQFTAVVKGNLYVVVRHRNHLDVISKWKQDENSGLIDYDFTQNGRSYGTGSQKDAGGGVYIMIAGDSNGDGTVDNNDVSETWQPETGESGYLSSDLNLDGESNNIDKNDLWLINSGKVSYLPQ